METSSGFSLDRTQPSNGKGAIRIDYRQDKKYYGSGYRSLPELDITGKSFLTFSYRGTTGIAEIQLQSDDSGSQSSYRILIPASSSWTVVNLPLGYFFGNPKADFKHIIRLKFFLENTSSGSLYLDDIVFAEKSAESKNEFIVCEPGTSGWEPELRKFEHYDKQSPPAPGQILFLGSSSIRLWDLKKYFPDLDALNRGFGGSHISDSLQFVDRLVFPYQPRLIVFYAGDNDIASGKSPEHVLQDYKDLVAKIHQQLPNTPIVYISIKPSLNRWEHVEKMRETNQLIQDFSATKDYLEFLDIDTPMIGEDGKPRPEYLRRRRTSSQPGRICSLDIIASSLFRINKDYNK